MSDLSEDKRVADEIKRELVRIGDDTQSKLKTLEDSFQRDLKAARDMHADGKQYTDASVRAALDSATAKFEALTQAQEKARQEAEARFSNSLDEVRTVLNRRNVVGAAPQDEAKAHAAAVEFKRVRMSLKGDGRPGEEITVSDEEIADLAHYGKAFRSAVLRKDEKRFSGDELKALTTGEDPSGGWQVPPAMYNRIIEKIWETSPIRQLATVIQIGSDRLEYPISDGEAGAGWVGEEELRPETTTPTVATGTILVHEQYAKPKITQRLLDDAATDVEGWLAGKVAEKMARMEATAFVTGNGIKKPRGILSLAAGTTRSTVQQIASGNASALTADAIVALPFSLQEAYLPNARFLLKRSTLSAVALMKSSQGDYLWSDGLRGATGMTLVGYPVSFADDMPAVAANSLSVAFGDFREAYLVVDRLGITMLRDPYSSKPFVEYYSRRRLGADVVNSSAYILMKTAV